MQTLERIAKEFVIMRKNRIGQIAYQTSSIEELVDALFAMAVKLKEEGVI